MDKIERASIVPLLLAIFCVLVWGLSFSVTRDAVRQIPPLTLAGLRFSLAGILLWLLTRKQAVALRPEDRKWVGALTLSGVTLYFAFENIGLQLTTASHGSLIIATIPLGTELVVAWRRRRWPGAATWLGALAALSGVGLLVGRDSGTASMTGDLLMFGAVACWIVYTFLVQRLSGRYPSLLLTTWIMLAGALSLMPAAGAELFFSPWPSPDPATWGQVLFLGIVCSALGYDFWNRAVPVLGPRVINTLLYFIPLVGVAGGVLFLDEPLTPNLFFGGVLISCGVLLARWG
ncbi:MAG: DMT family transporter [Desulfatitalea sp.]